MSTPTPRALVRGADPDWVFCRSIRLCVDRHIRAGELTFSRPWAARKRQQLPTANRRAAHKPFEQGQHAVGPEVKIERPLVAQRKRP
jgi:hypothetical protein